MGCVASSAHEAVLPPPKAPPKHSPRTSKAAISNLGKSVKKLVEGGRQHSSERMDDSRIKSKQEKWLKKTEKEVMKQTEDVSDWDKVWNEMTTHLGKSTLSFEEMDRMFKKMDISINRAMMGLMFSLFDVNKDGVVDHQEFLVVVIFLTQRSGDAIDMAFSIFDSNRSGSISKTEFNDMVMGMLSRARFILSVPILRETFRAHLEADFCVENLDFIEACEKARVVLRAAQGRSSVAPSRKSTAAPSRRGSKTEPEEKAVFPVEAAEAIYQTYVSDSAARQVNLIDGNRRAVLASIESAKEHRHANVTSEAMDKACAEIIRLMETDSVPRYKEKIRSRGTWLADQVWKAEGLGDRSMSREQFRHWAEKNPGVFSFLEDLQLALRNAENRQKYMAALRVQRWWRSRLNQPILGAVVEEVQRKTRVEARQLVVRNEAEVTVDLEG